MIIAAIVIIGLAWLIFRGRSKRTCPRCAEKVQNAASVCRFCHGDLPPLSLGMGKAVAVAFAGIVVLIMIKNAIFGHPGPEPIPDTPPVSASAPSSEPAQSKGPSKLAVMTLAERKVRAAMRDPEAADIRNTYIPQGAGYMCGEVNGTNGFGGKTGYRRFIAGAAAAMPVAIEVENMSATEFERSWSKLCSR